MISYNRLWGTKLSEMVKLMAFSRNVYTHIPHGYISGTLLLPKRDDL